MQVAYFLGNKLLAQTDIIPWWSDTDLAISSLAYLCPTCGEVWARVAIRDAAWTAAAHHCERCAGPRSYLLGEPGSFIHPWLRATSHFPREVLIHEVLLRIRLLDLKDLHD